MSRRSTRLTASRPREVRLAATLALLFSGAARAQPPEAAEARGPGVLAPWSLGFEAPLECPSEAEFRREVDALLAEPPSDLAVTVTVDRVGVEGYRLELRTIIGVHDGRRRLDDLDCRAVVSTAASIVAWAVSGTSSEAVSQTEPVPMAPPVPTEGFRSRDESHAAHPPSEALAPKRTPAKWQIGAGPSAGLGVAPSATLGAHVFLAWVEPAHEFGLGTWASPPLEYLVNGDPAQFESVGVSLSPCARWPLDPLAVLGCGEVAVDWIRASRPQSGRGTTRSIGLGGGFGLEWSPRQALALRATVVLRAAVERARLVQREGALERPWWNSSALGGRAGFALAIAF